MRAWKGVCITRIFTTRLYNRIGFRQAVPVVSYGFKRNNMASIYIYFKTAGSKNPLSLFTPTVQWLHDAHCCPGLRFPGSLLSWLSTCFPTQVCSGQPVHSWGQMRYIKCSQVRSLSKIHSLLAPMDTHTACRCKGSPLVIVPKR